MAQLLRGLGRTNVLPQTIAQVGNLALGLQRQKEQERTGALTRQLTELNINKAQADLDTSRAETTRANEPIRIDTIGQSFGSTPGKQAQFQFLLNDAMGRGVIKDAGTPNARVSRGVLSAYRKDFESDNQRVMGSLQAGKDAVSNAIAGKGGLNEQIQAYEQKNIGKDLSEDKTHQGLLQQRQALDNEFRNFTTQLDSVSEGVEETLREKRGIAGIEGVGIDAPQKTDALAVSMFGQSFSRLSQPQQQAVLEREQERKVEVSGARVVEGIKAKADAPLSAGDLIKFIHPETFEKFPAGTTMNQVAAVGGFATTPVQQDRISEFDNVGVIVDTIDIHSKELIVAESAIAAAAQGASLFSGAKLKTNPVAAAYQDQKAQFTGVLSRSLGGEKGVLTDRDIERIVNGMPGFGDTRAIRDFKMGTIQLLLSTAKEAQIRKIKGGRPSGGHRKQIQNLVSALTGAPTPTQLSPEAEAAGFMGE